MSTIELESTAGKADSAQAKNPHGHPVQIDDQHLFTPVPTTGIALLQLVGKKPCAYELREERAHPADNKVILPDEVVVLPIPGLKRFVTVRREIVFFTVNGLQKELQRGQHSVAEILGLVGQSPDAYMLMIEKPGAPPVPIPPGEPVVIEGCETFLSQVNSGSSS